MIDNKNDLRTLYTLCCKRGSEWVKKRTIPEGDAEEALKDLGPKKIHLVLQVDYESSEIMAVYETEGMALAHVAAVQGLTSDAHEVSSALPPSIRDGLKSYSVDMDLVDGSHVSVDRDCSELQANVGNTFSSKASRRLVVGSLYKDEPHEVFHTYLWASSVEDAAVKAEAKRLEYLKKLAVE